jgi:hypothetical protein
MEDERSGEKRHRGERRRRCEGSGAVWSVNKHGGRGRGSVLKNEIRGVRHIVKTSVWKSSPGTGKRPGPDWTITGQDRK